jgi:lactose/L-arabinose transport system substrate-binding protein
VNVHFNRAADRAAEQASALSRRRFLRNAAGLGAATALGGLTACTPAATNAGEQKLSSPSLSGESARGEVTIWSRQDDLHKCFDAAIPSFNKKYPNIKVKHVGIDVGAKLPPALVSGAGVPDGSFFEDVNIVGQAEHLLDLSERMAPYKDKTIKFKIDVATIDGRLVGIPWDTDPGMLYYREDVLDQAGVDPAALTTYDGLLAAARTIKEKRPDAKPLHLERDPNLGQMWLEMFANQQGTGLLGEDGKLRLDSPEYRQVLGWIQQVSKEGLGTRAQFISPSDLQSLEKGTQSLIPWACWWNFIPQSSLKTSKGKWRVTRLPAWKAGGARSGVMGGSSFVIPAKAKNPELAWLFFEHLVYSEEGYTKVFGPNSVYPGGLSTVIPSYLPALEEDKPLFKPVAALGNQDMWTEFVKAAKDIPPGYKLPRFWTKSVNYLGSNLQRLMDGQATVDDVIAKSLKDIQKNLLDR